MCDKASATRLVLAVSGGVDSTALLHIAASARAHMPDPALHVVTVDHGLRPESNAEARAVGRLCNYYGLPHDIVPWHYQKTGGNLSALAREARYEFLGEAAWRVGAQAVITAHHLDDQIETHLLAAARGGAGRALAGMRPVRALRPGVVLARPFLATPGARLRTTLRQAGVDWHEDPTNRNMDYARARMRAAIGAGTVDRAAASAELGRAEQQRASHDRALAAAIESLDIATGDDGVLHLSMSALGTLPGPLRAAVLVRAVTAAGGALYPPPLQKVIRLMDTFADGPATATLGGARVSRAADGLSVQREYGRAGPMAAPAGTAHVWFDRRFVVAAAVPGGQVMALGAGSRGNSLERCLPILTSATGDVVARHPAIRAWRNGPLQLLDARQTVAWRLWADLA